MSKKKMHALMAIPAALAQQNTYMPDYTEMPERIPKEKPIPNGCTRFYYNKNGECHKGEHEVFFDALTRNRSYKKFSKWLKG